MKPYRCKLSREDADTRAILITTDRWSGFPAPMQEFAMRVGRRRFATRIVAEDCARVPPAHQHAHLEAGHFSHVFDFSRGAIVEIEFPRAVGALIRNG